LSRRSRGGEEGFFTKATKVRTKSTKAVVSFVASLVSLVMNRSVAAAPRFGILLLRRRETKWG